MPTTSVRKVGHDAATSPAGIAEAPLSPAAGSEQRQTEPTPVGEGERLRQILTFSQSRFDALIESSPEAMALIGADGSLLYANPPALRMMERGIGDRIAGGALRMVHPDDVSIVQDMFQRLLQEPGGSDSAEIRYRQSSGPWRWVEVMARNRLDEPALGGVVLHYRDVTERREAEEALRASEARFRLALEMTSDYAYGLGIDDDGRPFREWEAGDFTGLLGYTPREIEELGGGFAIVHPDDQPRALERVRTLLSGSSDVSEFRVISKSGEVRWVREHGRPEWDEAQGRVVRIYAAAEDITDMRQAEEEARLLQSIPHVVADAPDLDAALTLTLSKVCEVTGWALGQAWAPRADGDVMECVAAWSPHEGLTSFITANASLTMSPGRGLIGEVWATRQSRWQRDVLSEPTFLRHELARSAGLRSGVAIPIVIGEQVIALLEFFLFEVREEDERRVRLVSAVAAHLGSAFRRKQAEVALHESEQRFRSLAASANDAIVSADSTGHILSWNRGAELIFGYTEAEALGNGLSILMPERYRAAHAQGLARVTVTRESRLVGKQVELEGLRKDGTEFPLELSLSCWETGAGVFYAGILRDTTERKLAESRLRYRLELEQIISTISSKFINLDPTGVDDDITAALGTISSFADVQRAYVFQLGSDDVTCTMTHEWCADGKYSELASWQSVPITPHMWWIESLRRAEVINVPDFAALPPEATAGLRAANLSTLSALRSLVILPMIYRGALVGFVGFDSLDTSRTWAAEDISLLRTFAEIIVSALERRRTHEALVDERAQLARRVDERTADLSAANAELARAARLKDEFLASMSHELRTPLNAILGISEALQEQVYGPLNEKQLRSLRNVGESGHHLLALINDILDLSKIEANKLEIEVSSIPIAMLCDASLRLVREAAQKKRLRVSSVVDGAVQDVEGDARRLKQMLINLLSNAIKFTPEGGEIGLEVSARPEEGRVAFTVWDSGIGIATEDLPRLFQNFVQLDSTLARQYPGTGLGLALVRRLAELHGGSVTASSEPERGSRFTVLLPWSPGDATAAVGVAGTQWPELERVLLIEDSGSAAEQLTRYLSELSVRASTHACGAGAVDKVVEVAPDLVILDILLPDCSGWQVLAELKADSRTADIPVLVLSVLDERKRGLDLGAAEYLVKPVTRQRLRAVIAKIGAAWRQRRARVPSVDGAAPLILLAEDNEMSMQAMTEYLQAKGYQLILARNGEEAVALTAEHRPQLILMDVQMPIMDGLEATRRIRATPALGDIPIIALTALAMAGDRERCLDAGADAYLSKPVSLTALLGALQAQLPEGVR